MQLHLKDFLLNEEKEYFGQKVATVMNAVDELSGDAKNMGSRHLNRLIVTIVNQIRQILHNEWSARQREHLEALQKIAVSLMKGIDEKGDLEQLLQASLQEIHAIMEKLGVPANEMGSDLVNSPGAEAGPPPGGDQPPKGPPPEQPPPQGK